MWKRFQMPAHSRKGPHSGRSPLHALRWSGAEGATGASSRGADDRRGAMLGPSPAAVGYFVAELNRRTHLAALDQVGVRFEDGIYLLRRGHLFAIEHTTARLADHARAERAIMRDLLAQGLEVQGGERVLAAY
jgi:hypothetical protein